MGLELHPVFIWTFTSLAKAKSSRKEGNLAYRDLYSIYSCATARDFHTIPLFYYYRNTNLLILHQDKTIVLKLRITGSWWMYLSTAAALSTRGK